ncbi:MAG: hypothetical protein Q7U47_10220 [Paludibacter sp.]|nr:hypothetical protein [Paludibacter sp.]
MSYKPENKHLTVLGFAGQKTNSAFAKAGKLKLKKAKENIVDAGIDFSSAISETIAGFKAQSIDEINRIDSSIAGFKKKIETAGDKIGAFYKDEIIRIENSKLFCTQNLRNLKKKVMI